MSTEQTMNRREILTAGGIAAGVAVVPAVARKAQAAGSASAVRIGEGKWTYTLVEGWGTPPEGAKYDMGCAIVVDSKDNVYMHSHAAKMVTVFDRKGKLLRDFSVDFGGEGKPSGHASGHGLYLHKDGSDEFLFFSVLKPYHQVIKTDLEGKVLLRIGGVNSESTTSIKAPFNNPTDVAVAPNGDIFVCEGYGGNVVRRFDKNGKAMGVLGKPGKGPSEFVTCHGIWVDTRGDKKYNPELWVADRNNNRLQVFTTDGKLKRIHTEGIRQPCCFYQYKEYLFVPDLDKVVTVLDMDNKIVSQLGDGRVVTGEAAFKLPHALTIDSRGDLYVIEWVPDARLRKFKRTPNKV